MTTAFVTRSLRCTEQQRTKVAALWNFTSNSSKAVNTCFATSYNDRRWNSRQPSSQKPIERSFDKISLFRDFSLTTGSWKQKSNSPQATASEDDLLPPKNLGIIARFKAMYKQYWYVMVPVHVITSTGWLVGFYYLSKSGVDIPALLRAISISENIINNLKDSSMGHFAIAYMCYKVMTPVRYMVTVGGTTMSIKYLAQRGFIKPIPSKERMMQMYDDKKAQMKQGLEDLQDKTSKERMMQIYDDKKALMKQGLEDLQDKASSSISSKRSVKK